jgi:hypothetical protein
VLELALGLLCVRFNIQRVPCFAKRETRSPYSSEVSSCQSDPNPKDDRSLSVRRPNDLARSALMLDTVFRPLAKMRSHISFLKIRNITCRLPSFGFLALASSIEGIH